MNQEPEKRALPQNFYFNGDVMPEYGDWWALPQLTTFLKPPDWIFDQDVGHRDIYIIAARLDHVGVVESADPGVFIYAVQEILLILLKNRDAILSALAKEVSEPSDEIYGGLTEAGFKMRESADKHQYAFWTSGHEVDRARLVEAIRRSQLPPDSPDYSVPPHVRHTRWELNFYLEEQRREFHRLAQTGQYDKVLRTRLHHMDVSKDRKQP